VRNTRSSLRKNALNWKSPPVPQSCENVVPCDETNGIVQPCSALYASIWDSGMSEIVIQVTSDSASISGVLSGRFFVNQVQPGQKCSGPRSMNW